MGVDCEEKPGTRGSPLKSNSDPHMGFLIAVANFTYQDHKDPSTLRSPQPQKSGSKNRASAPLSMTA
jgi:hypothetical protein